MGGGRGISNQWRANCLLPTTDSNRQRPPTKTGRVSIGMELVADSRVLILDEPTSGLDAYNARNLIQVRSRS